MPLEVSTNTDDPTRTGNTAINKAKVVKANESTADSKDYGANGIDNHYQKVL